MKKTFESISKSLEICLISTLLIATSFAHIVFAQGSVRHSRKRSTRVAARPCRRPPSTARVGRRVTMLPAGHRTVVVRGSSYYYHDGVFYGRGPSGYTVVVAPVGAVVARPPRGHTTVYVDGEPHYSWYYYNGAYYVVTKDGYVVVEPPVGATVTYLPEGSTTVYINGARHYAYGGVHYRPYSYGGRVVYRVAQI